MVKTCKDMKHKKTSKKKEKDKDPNENYVAPSPQFIRRVNTELMLEEYDDY